MTCNSAKRIVTLLLALLLLVTLPVTALADQFDPARTGSIAVQLRDIYRPETAIGGTVRLHKVGDITVRDSALTFVLTAEFSGSGVSLADVNAAGLPDKLLAYAENNNIAGTSKNADSDGTVTFSGLSVGLYLISQETAVSGYYKVSPFLVCLPMYEAGSDWNYNIQAAPKVQRPVETISVTVYKEWVDNNRKRPAELAVQLLQDGQVVDEVVLNKDNDWSYTWKELDSLFEWDVLEKKVPEGYKATYTRNGNKITITNKASWYKPPEDVLIQTGQLNWPVPALFGAGLLSLLLGLVLLKKREDYRNEA